MEERSDLRAVLLDGLTQQQRRETLRTIRAANAKKLARPRRHLNAVDLKAT